MASAILRSAAAIRNRLPGLLSSATRSTPRALEEKGQFLARRAGLPTMVVPRLFSSTSARRPYTHPCKLNLGRKRHVGLEGQLESINMAVKKYARGWREIREQFEQNQIKRAKMDKRHDRVVLCGSAAVTVALLGAEYVAWSRRKDGNGRGGN